jgi:hypothetical protein
MVYTMRDFRRDDIKEHLPELLREERRDVLRALPAEELLDALPEEKIRAYPDRMDAGPKTRARPPRRRK